MLFSCIKVHHSSISSSMPLLRTVHGWGRNTARLLVQQLKGNDPYKTLGISSASDSQEIKSKYYQLCRTLHPDSSGATQSSVPHGMATDGAVSDKEWQKMGVAERRNLLKDRFHQVQTAYEILSNPEFRQQYDTQLKYSNQTAAAIRKGGRHNVWAAERATYVYYAGKQQSREKTEEEKREDRRLTIGVFGFLAVAMAVSTYQKLLQVEDQRRLEGIMHLRSTQALTTARERAIERWREVPPGRIMESEERRLREQSGIATATATATAASVDELHENWPYGSGLGLIAVLDDGQLCGIHSRVQVADDRNIAKQRLAAKQALKEDKVVARYLASAKGA